MLYDRELHMLQCRMTARNMFQEDYSDLEENLDSVCPSGQMVLMYRCLFVIRIIVMFINFLLTVIMVHGARQKKPRLMAPWLWWQLSFVFLMILAIFNFGHFSTITINLFLLMIDVYIFLVVNSCYLQLMDENSRPSNVMVLAVARPHAEMHITIPSPLKDDPPPPYPGPTSATNPAYYPHDDLNLPAPPYTRYPISDTTTPPPPYPVETTSSAPPIYQVVTEPQNHQVPVPSASTGSDPPADESGNEAAPLVNRPTMPQK